ncbi:DUF3187 family protein [Peristeroidobacter soli]|uniref:DUF3187 family protein n=1 Tax=Peristeroidobacter soli TaxID=2497877 RepID=UPI0013001866|nr:DUF3187 family protein [Peristeroidobacter soli]
MKKLPAATLMLAGLAFGMPIAHAEDGQLYGLLRSRDLTPFGFLRLDMRPAHAVSIEPGNWAFETELAYQNTWALSPEVEKYLTSRESLGRHDLTAADVQAIRDLPGENYLLDLELALLDVTFHYKFSNVFTGYVIASGVSFQGGFLDSTIEGFHDTFGFSSFGRPAVSKNQVNLIYDLKSSQYTSLGTPTDGGLLDPTFGLRYTGWTLPGRWHLSTEVAVKVPIAGRRALLSTGRTDYGVQMSLQRKGDHHGFYVDAAAVYYDGSTQVAAQEPQWIPTLIVGYERMLTARTNVNLQAYLSQSVYSHQETDLEELLGLKYQYSIGIRHRRNNFLFTFGITENLQNVNNTPDIGFQLGLAWVPLSSLSR